MTKHAASGPFSTFCHYVVTKCAGVTKRAGSAFVVTKRAATILPRQSTPKGQMLNRQKADSAFSDDKMDSSSVLSTG